MILPPVCAAVVDTGAGPLSLLVTDDALVAAGFTPDPGTLYQRLPAQRRGELRQRRELGAISDAVVRYFRGDLAALDSVDVDQHGTPHQQRLWEALRAVPAGVTVSYTQLAARAGAPRAVRAAGSACARNLVALVVPCHRVVRSDGKLGGYYYGLPVKEWLLAHERRAVGAA
jgi:methylated-DNA-[protein]-cysteine S-methyltransferase